MAKLSNVPDHKDRLNNKKKLRRSINLNQIMQFLQLCALIYIATKL